MTRALSRWSPPLLLAGCSFAPHYVPGRSARCPRCCRRAASIPAAATDAPDVTRIGWRSFFPDARLADVIAAGLANNRDLRIAAANVLEARARYRVQRADLVPTVGVSASATYTNTPSGIGTGSAATGTGVGSGTTSGNLQYYSVDAGVSAFELDLSAASAT